METGAQMTADGRYLGRDLTGSCLIFDSFEETEQYCRERIDVIPRLRCDVFDSHGRTNPPIASFVAKQYEGKLDSQRGAEKLMRRAILPIAASFPLFWYTWKTRGEGWIAALFGIQLVVLGLRLLHWGYSMKEELRYRQAQADLRRQQSGRGGYRPSPGP